jgi:hypothetical protein
MTKNPFDQFAKQFFEAFLSPYGEVKLNFEVPGEPRYIDILFAPSPQSSNIPESLGLLRRIASIPCLIEPFRKQPTFKEVRSCVQKLFFVQSDFERKAKRDEEIISEDELPQLWIIAPSASDSLREYCIASNRSDWVNGVYFSPGILKMAIIATNELPRTPETLFFRLFGKGKIQQNAIEEILALPKDDNRRTKTVQLLSTWKITIEVTEETDTEDRELIMMLSQAYQEWEEKTKLQGQRLVVENLLKARFGEDAQLASIVPSLLALPTEEYTSLLLQLSSTSREELIARFHPQA